MAEETQSIKDSINEKMRLIRFRRKRENLRFWNEFKLVPRWLVWTMAVLFVIAQVIAQAVMFEMLANGQGNEIFAPELKDKPILAALALAGIVAAVWLFVAIILFMIGYVNQDAKRRGMSSALWTFLVIVLLPSSLVVGFVIYFLMREPLPYQCPQCGTTVGARFNFCPNCKCNLHPLCPNCKREVGEADKYCASCGQELTAKIPVRELPVAGS
jgi:hypothetical protein